MLLAVEDGHVLRNHANLHHILRAQLRGLNNPALQVSGPVQFEVDAETELNLESPGK